MILGVGTDIVETERIKKAIEKERFLNRYFTEKERALFQERKNKSQTIAAGFAAKEAVSKAIGTGFSGFSLEELEVLRDEKGKPYLNLLGRATEKAKELGIEMIHISLSHSEKYAIAFAVAEGGSYSESYDSRTNEKTR